MSFHIIVTTTVARSKVGLSSGQILSKSMVREANLSPHRTGRTTRRDSKNSKIRSVGMMAAQPRLGAHNGYQKFVSTPLAPLASAPARIIVELVTSSAVEKMSSTGAGSWARTGLTARR